MGVFHLSGCECHSVLTRVVWAVHRIAPTYSLHQIRACGSSFKCKQDQDTWTTPACHVKIQRRRVWSWVWNRRLWLDLHNLAIWAYHRRSTGEQMICEICLPVVRLWVVVVVIAGSIACQGGSARRGRGNMSFLLGTRLVYREREILETAARVKTANTLQKHRRYMYVHAMNFARLL